MVTRFLLLWLAFSVASYVMVFIATKGERASVRLYARRILISVFVGAVLLVPLFFINQIQGL